MRYINYIPNVLTKNNNNNAYQLKVYINHRVTENFITLLQTILNNKVT